MIPAGYLLKKTVPTPDWLNAPHVSDVCSVTDCVENDTVDIYKDWQYNRFGVANTASDIFNLAKEAGADISEVRLFYCEAYDLEMDTDASEFKSEWWEPIPLIETGGVETAPLPPSSNVTLLGYDVVVFEGGRISHSPLYCNHIAETLAVNSYCLLPTLQQAIDAIESGAFLDCEPGIYRIFSVNLVGGKVA